MSLSHLQIFLESNFEILLSFFVYIVSEMDLYRSVGVLLGTCLITLVSCQRQNMCQVLTRSEITYVLTESQRQELISQGYNFSTDPYNGIYRFFANPNGNIFSKYEIFKNKYIFRL